MSRQLITEYRSELDRIHAASGSLRESVVREAFKDLLKRWGTQLTGIPPEAWDYRLGNRSAVDWVLDQHKEKTPRDPTVREKFNTYRFADYKESMIDLLARVITVSLETVKITEAMRELNQEAPPA